MASTFAKKHTNYLVSYFWFPFIVFLLFYVIIVIFLSLLSFWVGTLSRSNWNLEWWFLRRGEKPEYPEKNLSEQGENQQQTQPTYDAGTED